MKKELISREQSAAMRGIAILSIMLHNFCHWLPMVQENEYTYTQSNVDRLLYILRAPGMDIVAQLLSFFGHYGVPVFIFLSAYGLVMKYESDRSQPASESASSFIWQHYKKLFLMMIVGYSAYVTVDYMTLGHRHYEFWNVVGQLGMFSNLYADPDHDIWPGPYWYFGLMVQIYLVYRLVLYRGKGSIGGKLSERAYSVMFMSLFVVCIAVQFFLKPESMELQWYRYNVMGSLPVFLFGLMYARSHEIKSRSDYSRWEYAVVFLLMAALSLAFSLSFYTWHFVPFVICCAAVMLVRCLPAAIIKPLAWVGGISAAMFVCHPITRKILIPISRSGDLYAGLLLYLVATIVLAIIFKHIISIVKSHS